jgi:ATP-dependent metalloprotease FtsH
VFKIKGEKMPVGPVMNNLSALNKKAFPQQSNRNKVIDFIVVACVGLLIANLMIRVVRKVYNRIYPPKNNNFKTGEIVPVYSTMTFKDVVGIEEAKEQLTMLVNFLKNPSPFTKMGARIPRGILLIGPPGIGKTLVAKAVAGEANCPFFAVSGSDFVEMFVGVGASRVRDLFNQAKQHAPCIIFIDEIDAVGGKRSNGEGGYGREQSQTINQLFTEMDGFNSSTGVVVIAATNRSEVLDPALLRAGRFNRHIYLNLPNQEERFKILELYAKIQMEASVNLQEIASKTEGANGADLANILNEAAINAVLAGKQAVSLEEIEEALEVFNKKVQNQQEQKRTSTSSPNQIHQFLEPFFNRAGLEQKMEQFKQAIQEVNQRLQQIETTLTKLQNK